MRLRLASGWHGLTRRLRLVHKDPGEAWVRLGDRTALTRYLIRNLVTRRRVTGTGPCVVAMTTYGQRAQVCFAALESIARSDPRPLQLILWIDESAIIADLPRTLRRMQKRGLLILTCENFGPHKKQFPFSRSKAVHDVPLVTADDDVLYPKGWLAGLLSAHAASPHVINAYRARRMEVREGVVRPYAEWELKRDTNPSLAAMATGTSGVIYPPALLDALRSAGTAFLDAAPQADDVWVHAIASGQGIMTRQIAARPLQPRPIRGTVVHGTNEGTLTASNVAGGQNDIQIARCYDSELIARMCNEVLDDQPRR